jgi:DnaJ domain
MSDAFHYRPKFVDIRVKKAGAAPPPHAHDDSQVRPCDQIGCKSPGNHRAPKGREHGNEYWHFCLQHVSDYNKRWNYFAGMSDAELAEYRAKEEVGHRPTWTLRGGRGDRLAATARGFQAGRKGDAFGLFGVGAGEPAAARPRRRLTRLQAKALESLSLPEDAAAGDIRTRYAELVKRWHPDSNGGDRGAETNLQRVLAAYQVLKSGGLV